MDESDFPFVSKTKQYEPRMALLPAALWHAAGDAPFDNACGEPPVAYRAIGRIMRADPQPAHRIPICGYCVPFY